MLTASFIAWLKTSNDALEVRRAWDALGDQVRGEEHAGMLDQRTAPIGPRSFIKLAKSGQKRGAPGIFKVGRRWLTTRAAMAAEMTLSQLSGAEKSNRFSNGSVAELRAELAQLDED